MILLGRNSFFSNGRYEVVPGVVLAPFTSDCLEAQQRPWARPRFCIRWPASECQRGCVARLTRYTPAGSCERAGARA